MRNNKIWIAFLVLTMAFMPGCASTSNPGGLTEREVGGLAGAGMGAGTGAIIGSATGHAAAGTAIGLPVGLAAGALVGEGMRRNKEAAKEAAREEVMKERYSQPTPALTRQDNLETAGKGVEAFDEQWKYNPKTGQRYPDYYIYDPVSGEPLQPVRAS